MSLDKEIKAAEAELSNAMRVLGEAANATRLAINGFTAGTTTANHNNFVVAQKIAAEAQSRLNTLEAQKLVKDIKDEYLLRQEYNSEVLKDRQANFDKQLNSIFDSFSKDLKSHNEANNSFYENLLGKENSQEIVKSNNQHTDIRTQAAKDAKDHVAIAALTFFSNQNITNELFPNGKEDPKAFERANQVEASLKEILKHDFETGLKFVETKDKPLAEEARKIMAASEGEYAEKYGKMSQRQKAEAVTQLIRDKGNPETTRGYLQIMDIDGKKELITNIENARSIGGAANFVELYRSQKHEKNEITLSNAKAISLYHDKPISLSYTYSTAPEDQKYQSSTIDGKFNAVLVDSAGEKTYARLDYNNINLASHERQVDLIISSMQGSLLTKDRSEFIKEFNKALTVTSGMGQFQFGTPVMQQFIPSQDGPQPAKESQKQEPAAATEQTEKEKSARSVDKNDALSALGSASGMMKTDGLPRNSTQIDKQQYVNFSPEMLDLLKSANLTLAS